MSFAPGDEVVCVDDTSGPEFEYHRARVALFLVRGKHYVIREIKPGPSHNIFLVGVCRMWLGVDHGFGVRRFRPVRRESIEQFRQMCVAASNGKTLVKVD